MGSIIIANMQANLTMDTADFDQKAERSEQRLDKIENRARGIPTVGQNIGKDAAGGQGGEHDEHQRAVQGAAQVVAANDQIVASHDRMAASSRAAVTAHADSTRQIVASHNQATAEIIKNHQAQQVAMEAVAAKQREIAATRPGGFVTSEEARSAAENAAARDRLAADAADPASQARREALDAKYKEYIAAERAKAPNAAVVTETGVAPELPDTIKAQMRSLAINNDTAGFDAFATNRANVNYVVKANDYFNQSMAEYTKQDAPGEAEKRALATMNAETKLAKGIPLDPIEAAEHRLARAQAKGEPKSDRFDDGKDDKKSPFWGHFFDPAHRGGENTSLAYQRYEFEESRQIAPIKGFLGEIPGGNNALMGLTALAGPELAAVAAATAFGAALVEATKATLEYASGQEKSAAVVAAANQGTGPGAGAITQQELRLIREAGEKAASNRLSKVDVEEALRAAYGQGMTPEGQARFLPVAEAVQTETGRPVQQTLLQLTKLGQYGTGAGAFESLTGGAVREGDRLDKVLATLEPYVKAAAVGRETPAGTLQQFGAAVSGVMPLVGEFIGSKIGQPTAEEQARLADASQAAGQGAQPAAKPAAVIGRRFIGTDAAGKPMYSPIYDTSGMAGAQTAAPSPTPDTGQPLVKGGGYDVTAVRQIKEEMSDTEGAITGISGAFGKLTTFHVDWKDAQPGLESLKEAIKAMQKWWYDVAMSEGAQIKAADYNTIVKPWLDIAKAGSDLMGGTSEAFAKITAHSAEMPTPMQRNAIISALETSFNILVEISENTGSVGSKVSQADRDAVIARTTNLLTGLSAISKLMGDGSDTMRKMFTTPMMSPAETKEMAKRTAGMLTDFSTALAEEFYTRAPFMPGQAPLDPILAKAAGLTDAGNKILAFAGAGADTMRKATNLYVPSDAEIGNIVKSTMGMSKLVAQAIDAQVSGGLDLGKMTLLGDVAEQEGKVVSLLSGGIGAMAGMRNLAIPSDFRIKDMVRAVFGMVDDATAAMPEFDPNKLAKMKATGEAMQPVMGTVAAGVQALGAMRDLAMPTPGRIRMVKGLFDEVTNLFAGDMSMNADAAAKVQQGSQAVGAAMSAVSGGADALQKIRDTRLPSESELSEFAGKFRHAKSQVFSMMLGGYDQATFDNLRDAGTALGAAFGALNTGADYIQKSRDIIVPAQRYMDELYDAEKHISDRLIKTGQALSPETTKSATEYGTALQAIFGAVKSGEDAIMGATKVSRLPADMIDGLMDNLDNMTVSFDTRMTKWKKNQSLENAKFSVELSEEMDAIVKAEGAISGLGLVRFDYTGPIDSLFDNMDHMISAFAVRSKSWKSQMSDETHRTAIQVKEEMDAINSAVEPISKMEMAARVGPNVIEKVMDNIRLTSHDIGELAKDPQFQGENASRMRAFGNLLSDTFNPIKGAVDTLDAMNKPISGLGRQNLMAFIADTSQATAHMGTPAHAGPAGKGGGGGQGMYENCVIINGEVVLTGADAKTVLAKLTEHATIQQGGVAVNSHPMR